MMPYYDRGGIIYDNADCRDIVPLLESIDLVVTDPPYGINWKPRVNHRDALWIDNCRPKISDLLIGKYNCVWGGNYFADQLSISESWLLWLKRPEGFEGDPRTYATCEMAWTDYGGKPRVKTHVWDGGKRQGDPSNREFNHPAQKPLEIIRWCISLAPKNPKVVLDPFMGSGTTLRAAKDMGCEAIGIELEEKYCEIAANRLMQESMFGTYL